jgi:type II secretory pathway pseudopilin PulG
MQQRLTQDRNNREERRTQSLRPMRPSKVAAATLSLRRPILVVAILVAILGGSGCSCLRQIRQEAVLRKQLAVLNQAAQQFIADNGRAPDSVSDLLLRGYLKELPVDPFTGRNDTWQLATSDTPEKPGVQIHSGSDATSSTGRPYADW